MGQDERLLGCPAKVILLGSGILTLLLTSPGRRRRRGRSGETGARCFQHEVRRHPPGPHALALAAPRGLFISSGCLPRSLHQPLKAPRGPARPPAPHPSSPLRGLGPQRSHPQQTQVSETSGCQAGPAGAIGRPGQPRSVLARRATSRGTGSA